MKDLVGPLNRADKTPFKRGRGKDLLRVLSSERLRGNVASGKGIDNQWSSGAPISKAWKEEKT